MLLSQFKHLREWFQFLTAADDDSRGLLAEQLVQPLVPLLGVGAVKESESLDLVVQLEAWDPTKNYQRTGLESEYYEILGVNIPSTSIPVSPGRNLAVVLETAAINNRQKRMGYNAAKELLIRLGLDGTVE